VSPKRFLQSVTRQEAIAALRSSASVLEASLAAGLSGPGRLHDLTISCDALTPGEIASGGAGLELTCGWSETPFGWMLASWHERGICHLAFHDTREERRVEELQRDWRSARFRANDAGAKALARRLFPEVPRPGRLHLLLRGTNFQIKVWEALLRVPEASLVSYGQLARAAGIPGAARAVGSAVAANRIALLIPCHRVIRESGDFGGYRWGAARKLALHGWERAQCHPLDNFT
jgi:AraC family transcriptional regulator of adaptative response/methylated-DNA-[protein]-cysteine methyltransferase